VHIVQYYLTAFYLGETAVQVGVTQPQRFDLASKELYPGFKRLFDVKIMPGLFVRNAMRLADEKRFAKAGDFLRGDFTPGTFISFLENEKIMSGKKADEFTFTGI